LEAAVGAGDVNSLNEEDFVFVEVPPDDYRSIRRAILDLDEYDHYLADRKATPF
jgi:hypothetical protein